MGAQPMIDTSSEIEILESLNFRPEVPCALHGCETDAQWYLLCAICRAAETVCGPHKAVLQMVWDPEDPIYFDQSCKHNPRIGECSWAPLT